MLAQSLSAEPARACSFGLAVRGWDMAVDGEWIETWIASVAEGRTTMSQRSAASVDRNGGVKAAIEVAQARGVHLVRLIDDEGKALIAASLHPTASSEHANVSNW